MNITEKQPHSRAYLNQRRFLVVVPLIILPFVLMGFWAMGGGQGAKTPDDAQVKGFNTSLPGADNHADSTMDKMGFYDQAQQDSVRKAGADEHDPYSRPDSNGNNYGMAPVLAAPAPGSPGHDLTSGTGSADPTEARLQQKLAVLNAALNSRPQQPELPRNQSAGGASASVNSADIDRLENMMNAVQNSGGSDPEMAQLNGMLNQILDIQHPERVQSRLREASAKAQGQVFPVSAVNKKDPVTLLDSQRFGALAPQSNGFFSMNEAAAIPAIQNTIEAATCESQTLVSGAIIKLKLLNDVFVNGQLIPRNTFVFGAVNISGERMMVNVSSLRYGNAIFPVSLTVCDLDGLDGIHIPGAIGRDVAKESSGDALQNIGMSNVDPSISMQAMDMGLQAAKGLIGKKIRLVKVYVKAGYQILLKDEKTKN
jgi:conjugative transposon TraM protein